MAWEENPRICLHMQLIAILSRTGVVFLIAVKQNPDHPVANLNAACIALRAGDKTAAAGYLEKAMPCAERDLATGVLRMMEGHVEEAERLFEAADKAGLREEARHNLRILHPERY